MFQGCGRKIGLILLAAAGASPGFRAADARAGWVEDRPGKTVIHVKLPYLPNSSSPAPGTQADWAVIKEFVRRFPAIFAERYRARYEADPERYGRHRWDNVELSLEQFSGITIEGLGQDSSRFSSMALVPYGFSLDMCYLRNAGGPAAQRPAGPPTLNSLRA